MREEEEITRTKSWTPHKTQSDDRSCNQRGHRPRIRLRSSQSTNAELRSNSRVHPKSTVWVQVERMEVCTRNVDETWQSIIPGRIPSYYDVLADAIGVILGVITIRMIKK